MRYVIVLKDEAKKKRFHDCKTCASYKMRLSKLLPEQQEQKRGVRQERMDHFVKEVRVEKQGYYARRAEAKETMRNDHSGSLSMIMDGEDKSSHQYPHQPRVPEDLEKLTRIKLKVHPPHLSPPPC
jgi:hypothetical protein